MTVCPADPARSDDDGSRQTIKIRIVTSCTRAKRHTPSDQLTGADFQECGPGDDAALAARERRLAAYRMAAQDLYCGPQHVRLLQGVNRVRERFGYGSVELWIVSAGYGLVTGERQIVPYDCSFGAMGRGESEAWARRLRLREDVRDMLSRPSDLTLVLLGADYLRAAALDETVCYGAPTVFLSSRAGVRWVRGQPPFWVVPLSRDDTSRFHCGMTGLKGEVAKRLLYRLADTGAPFLCGLYEPEADPSAVLRALG